LQDGLIGVVLLHHERQVIGWHFQSFDNLQALSPEEIEHPSIIFITNIGISLYQALVKDFVTTAAENAIPHKRTVNDATPIFS
jgi:hypothetical protein